MQQLKNCLGYTQRKSINFREYARGADVFWNILWGRSSGRHHLILSWPNATKNKFWHSPLIVLAPFTSPQHFPMDLTSSDILPRESPYHHTKWEHLAVIVPPHLVDALSIEAPPSVPILGGLTQTSTTVTTRLHFKPCQRLAPPTSIHAAITANPAACCARDNHAHQRIHDSHSWASQPDRLGDSSIHQCAYSSCSQTLQKAM